MKVEFDCAELNMPTEVMIERCRQLSLKGFEVWIEGKGNGTFNLIVEKNCKEVKKENV